jgi:hypothetical protein
MARDEKLRLLRLASKNPDWQAARLATLLALNTTMRGCEIRSLRWEDVDLMGRSLTIRKSKTDAGQRMIPLNSTAYSTVLELRERARQFGGTDPQHFIFPHCENAHVDPTRPQTSWRSAWRALTRAIECPACGVVQRPARVCRNAVCNACIESIKSPTAGLRFHDLRHHAITELAESQASDQTIMAIAGHVSPRMLARYSHVRVEAKRAALEAIADRRPYQPNQTNSRGLSRGYDTTNDTTCEFDSIVPAKVLENNGRPGRTRTSDLFRVNEQLTSIFNNLESTDGIVSHGKYVVDNLIVYHDVYQRQQLSIRTSGIR